MVLIIHDFTCKNVLDELMFLHTNTIEVLYQLQAKLTVIEQRE